MMQKLSICLGIFLALAVSRFVPHPPNFTSLIALSFYVPVIFGRQFIPAIILSFAITDLVIGYHYGIFFTWGSVLLIGLISNYFRNSLIKRLSGALVGAIIFFIVTNFGVWISGMYEYSFNGIISCYVAAIPFFAYSAISTILFSFLIEISYKIYQFKIVRQ
tara:strand:- start:462 stop:947 length:486 start_codon:yes stop_codon:yes gene_type:complete